MLFVIPGLQVIPFTRFTARGKWIVPKAKKYLDFQATLGWNYRQIMLENNWQMLPPSQPLYIRWKITRSGPKYKVDFDNCLKSLIDAAQHIVFDNDKYILRDLGGELLYQPDNLITVEFGLVADL